MTRAPATGTTRTVSVDELARLLRGRDMVGTVADGRALLAAAEELKPDVVVLDIAMPLLNGLDAGQSTSGEGSSHLVPCRFWHRRDRSAPPVSRHSPTTPSRSDQYSRDDTAQHGFPVLPGVGRSGKHDNQVLAVALAAWFTGSSLYALPFHPPAAPVAIS